MENQQLQSQKEIRFAISNLKVECRAESADSRTIVGYAAKFDKWSDPIYGWFREKINRGAFDNCDMGDVVMCFNHDINNIMARSKSGTLKLEVDEVGLRFEFEVPNTTCGNDMLELVKRGDVNQCSFTFCVESDAWVYADKENKLDCDERTILSISKLYDTSLVVYPAYPDTEASARSLIDKKNEYIKQHTSTSAQSASRARTAEFFKLTNK